MIGLGYRREMAAWNMAAVRADFFEVVPENWLRRDRSPLLALVDSGRPVHLHGVSLNLGGDTPLDTGFLMQIRALMEELRTPLYSDHLAAAGDRYWLHDLFPIPFTQREVMRVSDRIRRVQDLLGFRISVENTTWYTNVGDMPEADFLAAVLDRADCGWLLDLNNLDVNHKNHGTPSAEAFLSRMDLSRVSYLHVAGHEYDARFHLHVDTHSRPVESVTRALAASLQATCGFDILLEWDNDIPDLHTLNGELQCLTSSLTRAA